MIHAINRKICPICGKEMIADTANYLPIWYCIPDQHMEPVKPKERDDWEACANIDGVYDCSDGDQDD